ncbi:hypothetical protein [Bradyrhizobium algeriense]|uniref:nSTAND3 domain-containing NTPase n=1 Tax=Bradyrhizobium algeriense TaxID=634784 RepID=UPI000D3A564F|nr:hypothetical protein [Bradyrhizobium algeriense]
MADSEQVSAPLEGALSSSVGATAAQAGYEYQLNVSVLAAVRLLLITKSATRITLEPANEEDLEADLTPDQPGRVTPRASLASGYKLVVQVKSRSGEPWSIEDFDRLLKHGKERKPAKHHLDDQDTRYLLVTNADAKGAARNLLVDDFEEAPDPAEFPASLKTTLPNGPEGRVAIWGGLTEKLIEFELNYILSDLLRVPQSRQPDCREEMRKEAKRRMRGTAPGVWTRDDLIGTIRSHGGYLASAAELAAFVPPANFEDMVAMLQAKNAIVIKGPSGTGKTLAAIALCDEARKRDGKLDVVTVNPNDDPSSTRRLIDTGPTLFYVEDPWGQYSLRGGSEAWTEQLPRLLRNARPERRYVVTSRSDMLGQARAGEDLKRWSLALDADHYRNGELAQIYDRRMDLLATVLQSKALEFRKGALEALETPLELDLFFRNLADGPEPSEADHAFCRRILDLSHRDAVEGVVVKYLDQIDRIGLSAVVWGLLAARGQIERAQLTALQRQLRRVDAALGDGLEKTVDRLVATRHLRQPARIVTFAHPSVRAGFEAFLKENWSRNEAALQLLIQALTELAGTQRSWGLETAARVLDSAADLRSTIEDLEGAFDATDLSRAAIDGWLEEALVDPTSDFPPLLQLAADVGSTESTPSELARWFINGVRRAGSFFIDNWQPPAFSDVWYERISTDTRSAVIAGRFVREQLPRDNGRFGPSFLTKLDRIATGLTPAFLAVAHEMIGTGFDHNVDAVAAGAIRDLSGYESVLVQALDNLAAIQQSDDEATERWRAIEDGEYDKSYEEYYTSGNDDESYSSGVMVDTYITTIRAAGRWQDLASHPRVNDLAWHWGREVSHTQNPPSIEELRAILEATRSSGDEHEGWDAARAYWDAALEPDLAERILSNPSNERLRCSLARCALAAAAQSTLIDCFTALAGSSTTAFVHFLVDVHAAQGVIGAKDGIQKVGPVLDALSPKAAEIFGALRLKNKGPNGVGAAALGLLEEAAATSTPAVLDKIVPVMIASGAAPIAAIQRWLAETKDKDLAVAATEAAIAIDNEELIWLARYHDRADARRAALEYLVPRIQDPLPPKLLDLVTDPGSRVRRALVSALQSRPHADHLPILMRLTRDQWSDTEPQYDEPESYPIAREAVDALVPYGSLSDALGDELLDLVRETKDRSLRRDALVASAQLCGPDIRKKIWTMAAKKELGWIRVDAMDALSAATMVEEDIVTRITAERVMKLPAPLAASATVLASSHLPVSDAVRILEQIGHSNSHRALLLLGAIALEHRDPLAALKLLDLLDAEHPARRLLDSDSDLLPRNVLDDLGDVRIRRYVRPWLIDRIAKE